MKRWARIVGNSPEAMQAKLEQKTLRCPMSGCWLWMGCSVGQGYAGIQMDGRLRTASRVVWELAHGPVPAGLAVLHRCDNRMCVNPAHLFVGTARDNTLDMVSKGRHLKDGAHHSAKLTAAQVVEIRKRLADGETKRCLQQSFGMSRRALDKIALRLTWRSI